MRKDNAIEKEILLRGYHGIVNWLRQRRFEESLTKDADAMDEVQRLVERCYGMLTAKYFSGVEAVDVEYVELPTICAFAEKACPCDDLRTLEWGAYTQEIIYGKLSLARQTTFPEASPSWCSMVAEFVLALLGKKCTADHRFQNLELLTHLMEMEELAWEFYRGFEISVTVLKEASEKLEIKPLDILGRCRMIEMADSAYDLSGQTQKQILKDLWRYEQNGGYVEFPLIVVEVARGYVDAGMYDEYLMLWKKLVHPILQYALLIYTTELPDDCLMLLEEMKKRGVDEIGLTLARDYWFRESVHTMEKLLQFEVNSVTKDAMVAGIIPIVDKVRSGFESGLEGASRKMFDYFEAENLTQWAFAMNTLGDKPESVYKRAYLFVLNTLKKVLNSSVAVGAFSTDTKDVRYLTFLGKKAIEAQDNDRCRQLEEVILTVVDGGKFGWYGVMNQDVLDQMVVIASLLHEDHEKEEILKMVWLRMVKYEGWNVTPVSRVPDQMYISAFILSAALLVEQDETYFKTLVGWAVDQANNVMMPSDALMAPIYVAEIVVTQCREEWRDWFEKKILADLVNFESVVKVLMQSKTAMSQSTKSVFVARKDAEWEFVKRQYQSAKQQWEWKNMEKMMKDVLEKPREVPAHSAAVGR